MKIVLAIVLTITLVSNFSAQEFQGRWNINRVITFNTTQQDYFLHKTDYNTRLNRLQTLLEFHPDGTFRNYTIPGCSQDKSARSINGTYKVVDQNYIVFTAIDPYDLAMNNTDNRNINYSSKVEPSTITFYYSNDNDVIKFIKTTGNLEKDIKLKHYLNLIDLKDAEIKSLSETFFDWQELQSQEITEAVIACLPQPEAANAEILAVKQTTNNNTVFLVKYNNELHYVVHNVYYLSKRATRIALFDDTKLKLADAQLTKIDNNTKLKQKRLKEDYRPEPEKKTDYSLEIDAYFHKNEVYKATYNSSNTYGHQQSINNCTVYIKNQQPFYVEYEVKYINDNVERQSITAFYIEDYNNRKYFSKIIKNETNQVDYPHGLIINTLKEIETYLYQ
jgi:hypothetical protein